MARLYPPVIEGSVPAFYESKLSSSLRELYTQQKASVTAVYQEQVDELYLQYNSGLITLSEYQNAWNDLQPYRDMIADLNNRLNAGVFLTVPFTINAAVSKSEVSSITLKFKQIQESNAMFTVTAEDDGYAINWTDSYAIFDLTDYKGEINVGTFYKIQIAFVNNDDEVGYYSNAGITKYTSYPKALEIQGLTDSEVTLNPSALVGFYSQKGKDITEKVYSYCFRILNKDFTLYATSGERIHNNELDNNAATSSDIFYSNFSFEEGATYYIQYSVTTINGLKLSTQLYAVTARYDYMPNAILNHYRLTPLINYDQGIVQVSLTSTSGDKHAIEGTFQILRSSSKDNFKFWYILHKFLMPNLITDNFNYEDNTVEHGITYQYAIQQFNDDGVCSARIYSDKITAKFEDRFLIGGTLPQDLEDASSSDSTSQGILVSEGMKKRQLRIRFNPSVSNYKKNLLEAKVDTLGNTYPFIFRNGQIEYRSFSISGIISYLSDNESRFISKEEIAQEAADSVELTDENIATERLFRDAVWKWLTDGELKLYKSPTEGNIIVRLMDVSLTPEKAVNGMVYSFTANAYEMDEYSTDNLIKYQFLNTQIILHKYRKAKTKKLSGTYRGGVSLLEYYPAKSIKMFLGEGVAISLVGLSDNPQENIIVTNKTGYYEISDVNITNVYFPNTQRFSGGNYYITYEYENSVSNTFSLITKLEYKDYPLIEMTGSRTDILSIFQSKKIGIDAAGPFRFIKTQEYKNVYTYETSISTILSKNAAGDYCVSYTPNSTSYVSLGNPRFYYRVYNNSNLSTPIGGINGKTLKQVNLSSINNKIQINDQAFIDITNTESYQLDNAIIASTNPLTDTKIWSKINIGSNVTALFGIKLIVNTYKQETAASDSEYYDSTLISAKTALDNAVTDYRRSRGETVDGLAPTNGSAAVVASKYNTVKSKYNTFVSRLETVLSSWED